MVSSFVSVIVAAIRLSVWRWSDPRLRHQSMHVSSPLPAVDSHNDSRIAVSFVLNKETWKVFVVSNSVRAAVSSGPINKSVNRDLVIVYIWDWFCFRRSVFQYGLLHFPHLLGCDFGANHSPHLLQRYSVMVRFLMSQSCTASASLSSGFISQLLRLLIRLRLFLP